jgi:Asp-tRNA(Asn)/Glu-tRNA(Gln) amidotransferase A subunit family amidase
MLSKKSDDFQPHEEVVSALEKLLDLLGLRLQCASHQDSFPLTSLQLVGPRFSEAALLNAGRLIEAKP